MPVLARTADTSARLLTRLRQSARLGRARELTRTYDTSDPVELPVFISEFWTARQRQNNRLHEVPYRACFKPELPRFFIDCLTQPGDCVFDPFMGRGTTVLEAALLDRNAWGCDLNPLSRLLVRPRLSPPSLSQIQSRLEELELKSRGDLPEDLLAFYHIDTLREIVALQQHLTQASGDGSLDVVDDWIRMVALTRLTGHSSGFFSVYTLPPNQAVTVASQLRINAKRNQVPTYRDTRAIILKKSRALLGQLTPVLENRLERRGHAEQLFARDASMLPEIPDNQIALAVTSPPFLDVVNYHQDNWLRLWFAGIEPRFENFKIARTPEEWRDGMHPVFSEVARITKPGGHFMCEVGEVANGTILLEEEVVPLGRQCGFEPVAVLINQQRFTKTANCWGVRNGKRGTNTNRMVLFRKD